MAFLYVGATNHDFGRNVAKGGMTFDPYKRKASYGTGAHRDDPFRFRFIAKLNTESKSIVEKIEKAWLATFEPIIEDAVECEDINRAFTVEGIRFTSYSQFNTNLQTVLLDLGLSGLLAQTYTNNEQINSLLIEYRNKCVHAPATERSHSGLVLREYQKQDICSTLHAFRVEGIQRGYWSIECGLGKTVMCFELIQSLTNARCIFVTPRKTLLTQTAKNFLEWKYPGSKLFACGSAALSGKLSVVRRVSKHEDIPSTGPFICISTYASLPNLKGADVDILIFDEAQYLVLSKLNTIQARNLFGLSNDNIRATWRLAITATPKNTQLIDGDKVSYMGMSHQEELYGPCLAERNYVFGRDNGFLVPFEVVCIKATGEKIRAVIDILKRALRLSVTTFEGFLRELVKWEAGLPRNLIITIAKDHLPDSGDEENDDDDDDDDDEKNILSENTILWYAVVAHLIVEAVKRYNSTRIVTYHTTKIRAELFKRIMLSVWPICGMSTSDFSCETIHSGQSNTVNECAKRNFRAIEGPQIRMLCNIRTLIEGFDEPSIDTTVIADNKFSPIDCKQIVGRGNRLDPRNPSKCHKVLLPFLAYEIQEDDNLAQIQSTGDYKVMRYTIKNIILSYDKNQSISQSVWVPKPRDTLPSTDDVHEEPIDPTERVWISDETLRLHDEALLASCLVAELAKDSFYSARNWMHQLARKLGWQRFLTESQISQAWNHYRTTHLLPRGIPHNPSTVYKEVGWIHWRDYTGIATHREEWQEIQPNEVLELIRSGRLNVSEHTMSSLRTIIETELTRKLPRDPKAKWKFSVYDLAERAHPGTTSGVRSWGKYPERLYDLLRAERILDAGDFEQHWSLLHRKYPTIPGIPSEIWNSAFWEGYEV